MQHPIGKNTFQGELVCVDSTDEREGSTLRSDPGPTDLIKWGGYIPDTRRAIVGFSSAAIIAMVGNLGGVTSGLLGIDDGKTAASLRLDALFPVKGFKRCLDFQNGFGMLRWSKLRPQL